MIAGRRPDRSAALPSFSAHPAGTRFRARIPRPRGRFTTKTQNAQWEYEDSAAVRTASRNPGLFLGVLRAFAVNAQAASPAVGFRFSAGLIVRPPSAKAHP